MSDFDNYDDLDAVRDFRSLATPYPGALDAAVRRRIFEQAAARGYMPQARRDPSAGPAPGTRPRGHDHDGRPPTPGATVPTVVELHTGARSRVRRRFRYLALLVVLAVIGLLARHPSPAETVDLGAPAEAHGAPVPAATPLTVDGWRQLVTSQADRPLAAGTYDFRRVALVAGTARQTRERWAASDRDGKVVTRPSGATAEAGLTPTAVPASAETAFDGVSYERLRTLPAEPAALDAELPDLQHGLQQTSPVATLLTVLQERVVPPDVHGAAVSELGRRGLVGSDTLGADDQGRPVATFALTEPDAGWSITVDPGDGAVRSWALLPAGSVAPATSVTVVNRGVETEIRDP
jgi:hypothetical protein